MELLSSRLRRLRNRALPHALLALLGAAAACDLPFSLREDAADDTLEVPAGAAPRLGQLTDHVLVISIDGLRPDAIAAFGARTLQRLMREGSYAHQAETIVPSKTLPSHTSMLTGVLPEVHGVTWNSEELDVHGYVSTPTIFAVAKAEGFRTAAFFSKPKLTHLAVPGSLDYAAAPSGSTSHWSADRIVDIAERYLESQRPHLLFVHLSEPDRVGHEWGWMSRPYGLAVREADDELAELLQTADRVYGRGGYAVIVTADHGGHGRGHGSADLRDVRIPWITWGQGVRPGRIEGRVVRTMDTAATALWLLGLGLDHQAAGQPVTSAYDAVAVPADAVAER